MKQSMNKLYSAQTCQARRRVVSSSSRSFNCCSPAGVRALEAAGCVGETKVGTLGNGAANSAGGVGIVGTGTLTSINCGCDVAQPQSTRAFSAQTNRLAMHSFPRRRRRRRQLLFSGYRVQRAPFWLQRLRGQTVPRRAAGGLQ